MTIILGNVFGGIGPVIEAVASRLESSVPDELRRLEEAHGRPVPATVGGDPDLWRDPGLYARTDRSILGPDDYPAVLVTPAPGDAGAAAVEDLIDGSIVWKIPYRLRVWAFCRYHGAEEVAACRNRLAVGVLQAVFRSPKLADGMAVDLSGWRQSFSDTGVDDDDASTVAGWWLEITVHSVETVSLDSLARADVIRVEVHPEADE